MNRQEQIESLEKYLREMAAAVEANPYLKRPWNRLQRKAYFDEHYPVTGTHLEQSIRLRLDRLMNAGAIAYLLRSYGHGLDRSLNLVTNQELTAHLEEAHRLLCENNGIHIALELFRDIVIHAAMGQDPQRNWMGV